MPKQSVWLDLGLPPAAARAMEKAGFKSLDDLRGLTRKEFLALPRLGARMLARCERLLGRELSAGEPERVTVEASDWGSVLNYKQWRSLGFTPHQARFFLKLRATLAGINTWTERDMLAIPEFNGGTLVIFERLLAKRVMLPAGLRYWLEAGFSLKAGQALVAASFQKLEDLAGRSRSEILRTRIGISNLKKLEKLTGRPFLRAGLEEVPSRRSIEQR